MGRRIRPTHKEVLFDASDLIVSKTDLKGRITYANRRFCEISGYAEAEVLGEPHAMIRHPDMPRAVFELLWKAILGGREIFAYVKNMTSTGDHYWVFAHVTPSFDVAPSSDGSRRVTGFHSSRRLPRREAIAAIEPLYRELVRIEASHANGKEALAASAAHLHSVIAGKGKDYDSFVFSL